MKNNHTHKTNPIFLDTVHPLSDLHYTNRQLSNLKINDIHGVFAVLYLKIFSYLNKYFTYLNTPDPKEFK